MLRGKCRRRDEDQETKTKVAIEGYQWTIICFGQLADKTPGQTFDRKKKENNQMISKQKEPV